MIDELAVAALFDDDAGLDRGAVWILFLNTDGSVKSHQKISSSAGGLVGPIADGDHTLVSNGTLSLTVLGDSGLSDSNNLIPGLPLWSALLCAAALVLGVSSKSVGHPGTNFPRAVAPSQSRERGPRTASSANSRQISSAR